MKANRASEDIGLHASSSVDDRPLPWNEALTPSRDHRYMSKVPKREKQKLSGKTKTQ